MSEESHPHRRWTDRYAWIIALAWLAVVGAVSVTIVILAWLTRADTGTISKSTNDVQESQVKFQQCVVAVLFVPPEQRAKLTDEKVAAACDVDIGKVREIRAKLQ